MNLPVFYHVHSGMIAFIRRRVMISQRGSALLITLVLITVIGSIAFGVGKTTLSNFRQVSRLEDSLNAYQAAQAGIEDGLARFRYVGKNAEAPSTTVCPGLSSPTATTQAFSRTDLTANTPASCLPTFSPPTNPSAIVYDLKMYYKKDVGQDECIVSGGTVISPMDPNTKDCVDAPASQPALARDTAVEYDIGSLNGDSLTLDADFVALPSPPTPTNPDQRFLEVTALDDTGNPVAAGGTQFPILIPSSRTGQNISSLTTSILLNSSAKTLRFRPFGADLSRYQLHSPNHSLDSRITHIESIGYFGASKRKLNLTLDRLSGSIYEVFDFVLFSGNGSICGPDSQNPCP